MYSCSTDCILFEIAASTDPAVVNVINHFIHNIMHDDIFKFISVCYYIQG